MVRLYIIARYRAKMSADAPQTVIADTIKLAYDSRAG